MFVSLALSMLLTAGADLSLPDGGVPTEPKDVAIGVARALLRGDVDVLTKATPPGFAFDGRQTWTAPDARAEWVHALEQRPLAGVPLYGVEVISYDDMLKRYGKPPARLSQINFVGTQVAIINLGGRPILLIFKKRGEAWSPIAISD